ncbi:diacylglycerol kinase [Aliiglaciecola lipolytica]|uniref:Diacylglycerol kinase n=1 Tax=Aliiglaciecola lipolytica E3 TaxID=1127673 RepID=K6XN12_9ALTE|nr:diacylglycerol kinase [Aliiglaciecola lipolytica]GAC13071.1 diacylglycerol kinase [Aliiglaciecola lipolytica E3]
MKNKIPQTAKLESPHVLVNKPNGKGVLRILKAMQCSIRGFIFAWRHESAFRQELIMACVMLPFAFVLSSSIQHLVVLIISLLFVLFAEIINSAIEALADAVTLENNALIGRAKDMGSSAVFISLTILTVIWVEAIWRYVTLHQIF